MTKRGHPKGVMVATSEKQHDFFHSHNKPHSHRGIARLKGRKMVIKQ